jgi:hypothetical protein
MIASDLGRARQKNLVLYGVYSAYDMSTYPFTLHSVHLLLVTSPQRVRIVWQVHTYQKMFKARCFCLSILSYATLRQKMKTRHGVWVWNSQVKIVKFDPLS